MDRPLGSRHPEYPDLIYPINYGFLPETVSGDGEPIDAYLLGISEPIREYDGIVITSVHRKNDLEDKLVVSDRANRYSREKIETLLAFQERFFQSEIILPCKTDFV